MECGVGADFKKSGAIPLGQVRRFNGAYDELARGTLIRVLQRFSHRLEGLYLYYPHRNVSPALRALIDTLRL